MRSVISLLALLLVAIPGAAQEVTGSVQGTALGPDGDPLPGVGIRLTGTGFPSGALAVTGVSGVYRLLAVPPGEYTMEASLDGFLSVTVPEFRLNLGAHLTIDFEMEPRTVAEAISVTSEVPLFSITTSDTSATIGGVWLEKLALSRDFTSVVSLAAAANDEEELLGGISIDGSSGAENRFVIDGIDTTSLRLGVSQQRLVPDFVEEVQVKQGGYMAEFGGSTGGVINAVTKQGGSEYAGDVHLYWEDDRLYGDLRPVLRYNPATGAGEHVVVYDDEHQRLEPGFTLGGPLLRDRAWFFVGYSPAFIETTRTFNDQTASFDQQIEDTYITGNISGSVGRFSYRLGGNIDDSRRTNELPGTMGLGSRDPGDFGEDREQPGRSYTTHLDWLPTDNLAIGLHGGHFEYDTRDSGFYTGVWWGPSTVSAGTLCQQFPDDCDPDNDPPIGNNTPNNSGRVFDFHERDVLQLDGSYFLENAIGDHEMKSGVLFEEIGHEILDGYSNTRLLFYIDRSRIDLTGVAHRGTYGTYRVLQIADQAEMSSRNKSLFLQDTWRPSDRLTLNLGVRAEQEKIPSYAARADIPKTAIQFDYDDKLAPRLGFAYDVRGDGRWKAYGSWGVYYDMTKLAMPASFFGGRKWVDWFYALETVDLPSIAETCRVTGNSIDHRPTGCPGEFLFLIDRIHLFNDPDDPAIDPDLKPMESNELTLGVEHLLRPNLTLGLRLVHKELDRTIEDVGLVVPGVGEVYQIANPGEGIATNLLGPEFPNQPRPRRDYDAATVTLRKNYTDNWGLSATYTYSRLYGNYSGLSSSDEHGRIDPNVTRSFDSLHGSFDATCQPVFGRLGHDRPHQFKAQWIYGLHTGTFLGVSQRIASGTPISTVHHLPPYRPFFPYGRGDRGRTETFTQTDLFVSHEFSIGGDYGVELSLNVRNLFDEDHVTDTYDEELWQELPLSMEEFFAGFDPEAVIGAHDMPRDPRFGMARRFQGRREMRFGLRLEF